MVPGVCATTVHFSESRYTGKERDAESGNDYFGARYYASSMGRWMSPDPGWFMFANMLNPQSLNLYNYALDNPLAFIDIDGLELVRVVLSNGQSVVVDRSIAGDVISLVDGASNAGLRVTVTSGFRSIQHQNDMYNAWVAHGRRGNPVARGGHSSHNSGQSIDACFNGMCRNLPASLRNRLRSLGDQNHLPYADLFDTVHFGAGWNDGIRHGNAIDPNLMEENNANPNPDSTIADGGQEIITVTCEGCMQPIDTQSSDITDTIPYEPLPPPPPVQPLPDQSQDDHQ